MWSWWTTRGCLTAALLVGACTFDTNTEASGSGRDGAPGSIDAGVDTPDADPAAPDADLTQPDANPNCLLWETDFSSDPTDQNLNGDDEPDWAERDGDDFPEDELSGGVWTTSAFSAVIDTNPKNDFAGRTFLKGQVRSTVVGVDHGAVFWINVGYTISDFAPLFLSLRLENDATQTLRLYGKMAGTGSETVLATVSGLGTGFVDVGLDIDATANQVTLRVDSVVAGTYTYDKLPRPGADDRYATATSFGSEAAFNSFQVEACP